jgi:hypothetical protein
VVLGEATQIDGTLYRYSFSLGELAEGHNSITARSFDGVEESEDSAPLVITLDVTPPSVVSLKPPPSLSLDHVDVVFSEEIERSSLAASDTVLATPAGTTVTPTAVTRVSDARYRVSFPPQAHSGHYCLSVGPDASDEAGNPLDQDGDGLVGEDPSDIYRGEFLITSGGEKALVFDGVNDHVLVPHASQLDFGTGDFTIELWVNYSSLSGEQVLLEKWIDSSDGWTLTKLSNNTFRLAVRNAGAGIINTNAPDLGVHTWHHMALSRSGNLFTLFWDGVAIGSGSSSVDLDCPRDLLIGRRGDSRGFFFNGMIDEVRIWNVARTESEIQAAMHASPAGTEPNLVGYWKLDEEVNDQRILDSSASANHGTLGAGAEAADDDPGRVVSTAPVAAALSVIGQAPTGAVKNRVDHIYVTFGRLVDGSTFTAEDVVMTGPEGLIAVNPPEQLEEHVWRISFEPQSVTGVYEILIGPEVRDSEDEPMDQDQDGVAGEVPDDQYGTSFRIAGPQVLEHTPSGNAGSVDSVTITFDHPIDSATFLPADDFLFTGPEGFLGVTGSEWLDPHTLQFAFERQSNLGLYQFVLGPDIRDLLNNPMDQDGNFIAGEVPNDQYTGTFRIAAVEEEEPNDVLPEAKPLQLTEDPAGSGSFVARGFGVIEPEVDEDWWSFEAYVGDCVSLSVDTPDSDLRPYVYLCDASGSSVASDYGSGPDYDAFISHYTIPRSGTYFARVYRYYYGYTTGDYQLRLDLTRGVQLESDADYSNDDVAGANELILQRGVTDHQVATVGGTIMAPSSSNLDEDVFAVGTLRAGNVVELDVRLPATSTLLPRVSLLDHAGNEAMDEDGYPFDGHFLATMIDDGPYYAHVESGWAYKGHRYVVTEQRLTWSDAETYAQQLGGHLVTISDAAEQAWIEEAFRWIGSVWIGLTDEPRRARGDGPAGKN